MEFNLKAWKLGVVIAICSSCSMFLMTAITFTTPPPMWDLFRLAIGPAVISFLGSIIQMCQPKIKG